MPAKPRWLLAIPDAISQLENLDRTLLTRRDVERLFGVSKARAATLMQTFGAELTGNQRTLPRTKLLQQLRKHRGRAAFRVEEERRQRLVGELREARLTGIRVKLPVESLGAKLASLPEGVTVERDRIEVRFNGAKNAVAQLYALAHALVNDYERFERLVDEGAGGGEVVTGMTTEALAPAAAEPAIATGGGGEIVLPQVIVDAGPQAAARFLEFFAGRIANARTRAAYGRAVGQFLGWCEARGLRLRDVSPLHVAAYIRTHPGSVPTVKQHLAAIRMLGDWLVVSQVLPVNPAAAVRGPKHVVTKGATPVLSPAEARKLLESIDTGALAGLRDRALLSVMLYSFARVSAVLGMRRQDYFGQGSRGWLRLHEKGGKRHDVPAHHRAAAALDTYVEAGGLEEPKVALFQSMDPSGRRLTGRALERRLVLAMVKRRAATAGLPPSTCCHTFRATGITAYLSHGGTLEHAQQIAGLASPKTTKLYDRTADTLTVDEIERIVI